MEDIDTYSDLDLSDSETVDVIDKQFNEATNNIKRWVAKLDSATLLKFYSYYKQGTEGKCHTARPTWFDLQGKQKWDAWNSLGDMSTTMAKENYVKLMKEIDPSFHNRDADQKMAKGDSWASVSTMHIEEEFDRNEDKNVFDLCQENDLNGVQNALFLDGHLLNRIDENGLGLIHWACDRGHIDILKMLISNKCNVNLPDCQGQTPLHYAVSCGHANCVEFLLENGALIDCMDEEGHTPVDICTDPNIQKMLL